MASHRSNTSGTPLATPVAGLLIAALLFGAARADENQGTEGERPTFRTDRWDRAPNAVRAQLHENAAEILNEGTTAGATANGAPPARPTLGQRAGRAARFTGRMFADPRFAGAIVISDLVNAGVEGNPDRAADTMHALTTPEFFAGIGMFNASMMAGEAAAAAPFRALTGRVGANSLTARAAGALKHNLVLAGALTVPRMFEVDFGGFTFGDALKGEFDELKNSSFNFRADIDAQDVGITLGAFAVAQPVWSGIKRIGGALARKVGARLARTAAVKGALAIAPVPGTRVAAAALTVGEILWGAVDLAGLLITAHKIEEPVKEWNDHRRSVNAVREASGDLLALFEDGEPSLEELDAKLRESSIAFGNHRDFLFLPNAIEDVEFVDRLLRMGETRENMAMLSNKVMDDFGAWLAMPGQTSLLLAEYQRRIDEAKATGDTSNIPGGDLEAFEAMFNRYKERVRERMQELADARTVDADEFDPTSEDFLPSRNRHEVFEQELALYRRLLEQATDEEVRNRLLAEIETLEAIMQVDDMLRAQALGEGEAPPTSTSTFDIMVDDEGQPLVDFTGSGVGRESDGFSDVLGDEMGDGEGGAASKAQGPAVAAAGKGPASSEDDPNAPLPRVFGDDPAGPTFDSPFDQAVPFGNPAEADPVAPVAPPASGASSDERFPDSPFATGGLPFANPADADVAPAVQSTKLPTQQRAAAPALPSFSKLEGGEGGPTLTDEGFDPALAGTGTPIVGPIAPRVEDDRAVSPAAGELPIGPDPIALPATAGKDVAPVLPAAGKLPTQTQAVAPALPAPAPQSSAFAPALPEPAATKSVAPALPEPVQTQAVAPALPEPTATKSVAPVLPEQSKLGAVEAPVLPSETLPALPEQTKAGADPIALPTQTQAAVAPAPASKLPLADPVVAATKPVAPAVEEDVASAPPSAPVLDLPAIDASAVAPSAPALTLPPQAVESLPAPVGTCAKVPTVSKTSCGATSPLAQPVEAATETGTVAPARPLCPFSAPPARAATKTKVAG